MIKFPVKNQIEVSLPTSINEITEEYLSKISDELNIAPDYSLIALITVTSLKDLAFEMTKKKQGTTSSVIPVFVKCGDTDSKFIKSIKPKSKVVISRTSIELSDHIRFKNNYYTINTVLGYINSDDELRKAIMTNKLEFDSGTKIYLVEYKLVGNCDIHGAFEDVDNTTLGCIKPLNV